MSASWLASLPPERRRVFLESLSEAEAAALNHDWSFWARDTQLPPAGDWRFWLVLAGRGFGKSRTGAEWIRARALARRRRIALVAPTAADARDVMLEGESGILSVSPPWERPHYEPSKRRLTWPNGSVATLFSAEDPDALRGPQFDTAWCDEVAAWRRREETWDMLMFGLRLGDDPRCVVTTTPRPVPIVRDLLKDPGCITTRGSTFDNRANLAAPFFEQIVRRYEGTRLGRQELHAEVLDDVPGALWTFEVIERHRAAKGSDMVRVVVGVDPSGSDGESGDSQGIVVAGKGVDGRGYVLADASCRRSPDGWGRRTVEAYDRWSADRVVAEQNFGGEMVRTVLRTQRMTLPVKLVTASRGKAVRAEPVAALYEQGRVSHVGVFGELENQMRMMTSNGFEGNGSSDRLDALVWALTELMLEAEAPRAVVGSYRTA